MARIKQRAQNGFVNSKNDLKGVKEGVSKKKNKSKNAPGEEKTLIDDAQTKTSTHEQLQRSKKEKKELQVPQTNELLKAEKKHKNSSSQKNENTRNKETKNANNQEKTLRLKKHVEKDDETDSDEESIPDILGQSLADNSDENDEDFNEEKAKEMNDDDDDDDSDEDVKTDKEKKGIKMFKGIKSQEQKTSNKKDKANKEQSRDNKKEQFDLCPSTVKTEIKQENDDDDDDDDDDDEDDEAEASHGLKALLGDSIADDDEDEDFNDEEEDDEDDDISDDDEDDDISDDDDDDDNEKEETNVSAKIKKEDKSNKTKNNKVINSDKSVSKEKDRESKNPRTVYIGNLPRNVNAKELKTAFEQFGSIENVSLRGLRSQNTNAHNEEQQHRRALTLFGFVVFDKEASAKKALSMNGKIFKGNHLRVNTVGQKELSNQKKSLFLGNLPFKTTDDEIWNLFNKCGEIDYVHIIRNRVSGMGKGFGYVNFKSEDAVTLALELDGTTLHNRCIRVIPYNSSKAIKGGKFAGKKRLHSTDRTSVSPKKPRHDKKIASVTDSDINTKKGVKVGKSEDIANLKRNNSVNPVKTETVSFQGQKAIARKKEKRGNKKLGKKQKLMAAKLLSKPKKPTSN